MFVNLKTYLNILYGTKLGKLFVILLLLLAMGITSLNIYIDSKLPHEQKIKEIELQIPLKIFSEDGKLIGEFGEQSRTALKFKNIPITMSLQYWLQKMIIFFSLWCKLHRLVEILISINRFRKNSRGWQYYYHAELLVTI